jgi:hypothetical protein
MSEGLHDENDLDLRLEKNDPVWSLLSQSPRPEPDAWFTVRTLARCRYEGLPDETHNFFLAPLWRWALGGGLSLCLAVALVVSQQQHAPSTVVNNQQNVQDAFEIMASLNSDSDSSTPWQDSSL